MRLGLPLRGKGLLAVVTPQLGRSHPRVACELSSSVLELHHFLCSSNNHLAPFCPRIELGDIVTLLGPRALSDRQGIVVHAVVNYHNTLWKRRSLVLTERVLSSRFNVKGRDLALVDHAQDPQL